MNNDARNTYLRLCAQYYDLDKPTAHPNELDFYMHYALEAQGPILEPMCGTGRFLIPMLEAGLAIEGLDSSYFMLDLLQQKCTRKKLKPNVTQCLLQDFTSYQQYNLIFIPSGSFGLIINKQHIIRCLSKIYNLLKPNGIFVFEVDTPLVFEKSQTAWQKSHCRKKDGSEIVLYRQSSYNHNSGIVEVMCRYEHVDNRKIIATEIENLCVKLYSYNELDIHLKQIGFSLATYKAYSKQYATDTDSILVYECTKKF